MGVLYGKCFVTTHEATYHGIKVQNKMTTTSFSGCSNPSKGALYGDIWCLEPTHQVGEKNLKRAYIDPITCHLLC